VCAILKLNMPVPTPGREGEAPPLVLQELSTEPDLSASAGLAPLGELRCLPQAFRALRHRNFRLFAAGQIVPLVGTWMQNVAQAWLVYRSFDAFGIAARHGLVVHPDPRACAGAARCDFPQRVYSGRGLLLLRMVQGFLSLAGSNAADRI
jgi:hypothetical protein